MTANNDYTDAKAILGLMNLPRVGAAAIHRILESLAQRETAPGLLLDYDAAGLVEEDLLSEQQATLFISVEQRDWRSGVMAHLETAGVREIPVTSGEYPPHLRHTLGSKSPPMLMARGNTDLLSLGGIAFAGARRATERGLEIARTLVARAVEQEFAVISGGAAGVDAATHDEALARGGSTIVVLAEGDNGAAMALAACQGGMAFSNSSVCLVHGMSRPLGVQFHLPHGLSNAILLPAVTRFSISGAADRYAAIARAMRLSSGDDSTEAACMALVKELERLNQLLHIPTLKDCPDINRQKFESVLEKMAQDAIASGSPQNNPVVPGIPEIINLYEAAW